LAGVLATVYRFTVCTASGSCSCCAHSASQAVIRLTSVFVVSPLRLLLYTEYLTEDSQTLIRRLRQGDHRALARAITTVENRSPGWSELLKALFPLTGQGVMVGVTGAPGAGKSTLVDQLAKRYRQEGRTVGIIAVDPTSPYSGGAILGDRIRMQERFCDPGIYIRSMATRGSLGGLARATGDVATVLDASGHDLIMIETVGVGQDEIDVVRLADVTIVTLVPGMGDDVQSIKAGIMEIADIFVVNKSDWAGAERVEAEIRALQSLAVRSDGWTPPIVKTVASEGKGLSDLVTAIAQYQTYLKQANLALEHKRQNWQERLLEMLRDRLFEMVHRQLGDGTLAGYAAEVAEHKRDPYTLVDELVARVRPGQRGVTAAAAKQNAVTTGTASRTGTRRRQRVRDGKNDVYD
jgi:LAO/AO transport system kinase